MPAVALPSCSNKHAVHICTNQVLYPHTAVNITGLVTGSTIPRIFVAYVNGVVNTIVVMTTTVTRSCLECHTMTSLVKTADTAHLKDVNLCDRFPALTDSDDGRLVHEVHELSPCGTGCGPGHFMKVHISIQLLTPGMYLQDPNATLQTHQKLVSVMMIKVSDL